MLLPTIPNSLPAANFFKYGIAASVILMVVVGLAVGVIWPVMGMPILTK